MRLAALALLGAAVVGTAVSGACSAQKTAKAIRALSVFECRVAALRPYVGEVYDTEELVRDVLAGKASPGSVLQGLGTAPADIEAAAAAWAACRPPPALEELPKAPTAS